EDQAPWARAYLAAASLKGLLKGYPDGRFRPNDPLKREELVTALVRFAGLEEAAESMSQAVLPFRDAARVLERAAWARGYLAAARDAGILPGEEDRFLPGEAADRLWAAELLVRALGLQAEAELRAGEGVDFTDVKDVPPEKLGYLAVAVERGLLQGFPDGTFRPKEKLTRAQLAALLERAALHRKYLGKYEVRGTVAEVVYEGERAIVLRVEGARMEPPVRVPAYPGPARLEQPDGKEFLARQWGDERLHGWETADGYTIVKDGETGFWCYAEKAEDGSLVSTGVRADGPPPAGLPKGLRPELAGPKPASVKPEEVRRYPVSPDALVLVDGKEAALEDVKPGFRASLVLNAEGVAVVVSARSVQPEKKGVALRGWLVDLPDLEGADMYGLVPGFRWGEVRPLLDGNFRLREEQGPGEGLEWRQEGKMPVLRVVMALVPADDRVAGQLRTLLGKFVEVRGERVKEPNIYMRPVFRVNEVRAVEFPPLKPQPLPQPHPELQPQSEGSV
ncbi:MAG: S-layer homology domain-containing protein, partial [Bacillota bacterium]